MVRPQGGVRRRGGRLRAVVLLSAHSGVTIFGRVAQTRRGSRWESRVTRRLEHEGVGAADVGQLQCWQRAELLTAALS